MLTFATRENFWGPFSIDDYNPRFTCFTFYVDPDAVDIRILRCINIDTV